MHLTVTNSPFNEEQTEKINQILPTLTTEQKIWFSGYLTANQQAGIKENVDAPSQEVAEYLLNTNSPSKTREITILFGSETGNAQSLAESLETRLKEKEFTVKLSSLENFKPKDLKKVSDERLDAFDRQKNSRTPEEVHLTVGAVRYQSTWTQSFRSMFRTVCRKVE